MLGQGTPAEAEGSGENPSFLTSTVSNPLASSLCLEGGLAPTRDTKPYQVFEATPLGILRLVTRNK